MMTGKEGSATMRLVEIHPARRGIGGTGRLPYSKPHMQRAILLSLLTNAPSIIVNPAWSSEAEKLFTAARQFGLDVLHDEAGKLIVSGVGRSLRAGRAPVPVAGSAFNFRTLAALACLSSHETVIEGDTSMFARPVREHMGFIGDLGGRFEDVSDSRRLRVRIHGSRRLGGRTTVDTRHSSQVLTAVLLVAPLARRAIRVDCTDDPVGQGYVDLTLQMMREQGAVVEQDGRSFTISPSAYQSRIHRVASDFTALSYLAGAVATADHGEIAVAGYQRSSLSSEAEFFEVLEALGVRAEHDRVSGELRLRRTSPGTASIEIDGGNIPTVVPTLAAIAPFVEAKVTLRNAAQVNNHKCPRISVMIGELRRMGCAIEPTYGADGEVDGFATAGRQAPAGGVTVDSHGDHRIFLSLATAALGARRPTSIEGVQHLHASFPDYLEVMEGLGVRVVTGHTRVQVAN